MKSIVIEVRVIVALFSLLECPDAFNDNHQPLIYGKTIGPGLGVQIVALKRRKVLTTPQRWRAMREVDQLIMIIPVVLNLKETSR